MEVRVTWRRIIRFWWAITWRQLLLWTALSIVGFIVVAGLGIVIGLIVDAEKGKQVVKTGMMLTPHITSFISIFLVFKETIGRRIGGFKVVMVRADDEG